MQNNSSEIIVQYLFDFHNYTLQYTSVNIKKIKQNVEDGYHQKGRAKRSGKNYRKNKQIILFIQLWRNQNLSLGGCICLETTVKFSGRNQKKK